jgi:hypothetical protein
MVSEESRELARRGQQIYDERLKAHLEPAHRNEFVAIEPVSGDYFLGSTLSEAAAAARATYSQRRTYIIRVGHSAAVQSGPLHTPVGGKSRGSPGNNAPRPVSMEARGAGVPAAREEARTVT